MNCQATITVDGKLVTCGLENGPTHNPEHGYSHKAQLGDGRYIEWAYGAVAQPQTVGQGSVQ